jgi:undecaprenyl pyrophosphate synthase
MSQHNHTPSNAPAPIEKNKKAEGRKLPRTIAIITALNPDAANQSDAGAKKYKAHKLGF